MVGTGVFMMIGSSWMIDGKASWMIDGKDMATRGNIYMALWIGSDVIRDARSRLIS